LPDEAIITELPAAFLNFMSLTPASPTSKLSVPVEDKALCVVADKSILYASDLTSPLTSSL
jgi:hypothetical protein